MKRGNWGDYNFALVAGDVRDNIGIFFMMSLNSLARITSLCVIVPIMASMWLLWARSVAIFYKSIMIIEWLSIHEGNKGKKTFAILPTLIWEFLHI